MSEYQYYEFQAMDRRLSREQMDELRGYSSRAQITPTSFVNVYNYGDFRGDPGKLLDAYFDAFLYLAIWGTHRLMFRMPRKLLSPETVEAFTAGDGFSYECRGDHGVLSFRHHEEEVWQWEEGDGWLPALLPIRAGLMRGDHRALYLGWLLAVQAEDVDEDTLEPAVPPGLSELDASLDQLAQFLRIDEDLIAAAAEHSVAKPSASLSSSDIAAWISTLPAKKKDALLGRLVADEDPHLVVGLQQQALDSVHGTTPQAAGPPRRVAELLERAEALGEVRRTKEAQERAREEARGEREAAKKRKEYLESLWGQEPALWLRVHEIITSRRAKRHDDAVSLLRDLKGLAELKGDLEAFRIKMSALHDQHRRKKTLVKRLGEAELL